MHVFDCNQHILQMVWWAPTFWWFDNMFWYGHLLIFSHNSQCWTEMHCNQLRLQLCIWCIMECCGLGGEDGLSAGVLNKGWDILPVLSRLSLFLIVQCLCISVVQGVFPWHCFTRVVWLSSLHVAKAEMLIDLWYVEMLLPYLLSTLGALN